MSAPEFKLLGKTALVTGGASGIGRAIALMLAQAGANIAINHLNREAEAGALVHEIETLGRRAIAVEADVTREVQVAGMVNRVATHFGRLDVLVNNAGVILEKPFLETTEADWQHLLDVDLKGVFLCCRAALPAMLARGSGVVINVASDLGYLGRAGYAPYCAAKAGVIGLTRALAREFAPAIRVNAIAPGPVNTAMVSLENMSEEWIEKEKDIPAARIAEPEEIAATALFLASDLSRFYCGQVLGPNGGSVMP